jgi:hypothetical protein
MGSHFQLHQQTLFLAVSLFDRYLSSLSQGHYSRLCQWYHDHEIPMPDSPYPLPHPNSSTLSAVTTITPDKEAAGIAGRQQHQQPAEATHATPTSPRYPYPTLFEGPFQAERFLLIAMASLSVRIYTQTYTYITKLLITTSTIPYLAAAQVSPLLHLRPQSDFESCRIQTAISTH